MTAVRVLAPAKLNLYLRILGRRPDGYHELETLFERIDWADELTFRPGSGLRLTCDDPALDCGEQNLVLRAARLLQEAAGATGGADIHLAKRIPVAAGLGGGSSDAAATLIGLNHLWQLKLTPQQLQELAARLGSDVPFFLGRSPFAIGRGRGERCEPLPGPPPTLWHVIVAPGIPLSTAEVYAGFARRAGGLTASRPSITIPVHALCNGSLDELAAGLVNDLEPEAIRRCSVVHDIHTVLRTTSAVGTLVSGSGSAVFGLYRSPSDAQQAAAQLQARCPVSWRIAAVATQQDPVAPTGRDRQGICADIGE